MGAELASTLLLGLLGTAAAVVGDAAGPNFPSMALGAAVLFGLDSYLVVGNSRAVSCPIGPLGCEDTDWIVAWGRAVGAGDWSLSFENCYLAKYG